MENLTGCYGVVQLPGPIPTAISIATRSPWNHCFIMVSETHLVEAWVPQAKTRPLAEYARFPMRFSQPLPSAQRALVVAYALAQVGVPYDLLHFAGLTVEHLLGLRVLSRWPTPLSQAICSVLVARAGAAGGQVWSSGLPLSRVTPATLGLLETRPYNDAIAPHAAALPTP